MRDILFGVQLRDVDRRFARLEERLAKETADLKDDLRKRLGALEQFVRGEVDALSERLRAEQEQRTDGVAQLCARAEGAVSAASSAARPDRRAARAHASASCGSSCSNSISQLSDEITHKGEEVLGALSRESQQLRNDKTDRTALASLLTEMAHAPHQRVPPAHR